VVLVTANLNKSGLFETGLQHFVIIGGWVAAPVAVAGQEIQAA
jgi:hypothetical protein